MTPVVIADPRLAAEVRAALVVYVAGVRRAGSRAPDLEALVDHLDQLATGRPPAPRRPPRPWCSVAEAARLLGVSDRTVRRAVARGDLPHRRVGRRLLIEREALTGPDRTRADTGRDTGPTTGHGRPNDPEATP